MSDDEFGSDIEFNQELEDVLSAVESQPQPWPAGQSVQQAPDIEDLVRLSPMEEFRKKGYLSVSDLVGTVWCEVQYDYRLRTLPYLPPSKRPEVITTKAGKEIVVNKVKVEDKERILKRGQVIHERLEREIHPEEIFVATETREDVWGLRFITMLSGMQSLLDLGVCREMPVVGFINGILILGIIDEISRQPIKDKSKAPNVDTSPGPTQTALTSFFSPTKPRTPKLECTHKLKISDSKTRASGTLPRESDTTAGQLQVMLYKELFDAMMTVTSRTSGEEGQSTVNMSFEQVFLHLGLEPDQPFSEAFMRQSQPILLGNMLTHGAEEARCLSDMVQVWSRYVEALGLGAGGRSEDHLELVYRRAGGQKKGKSKRKRQAATTSEALPNDAPMTISQEEERQLQLAIAQSLQTDSNPTTEITPIDAEVLDVATSFLDPPAPKVYTEEEREKEEDAIALEVEMAYRKSGEIQDAGETIPVRASQDRMSPSETLGMEIDDTPVGMIPEEDMDDGPKSGGIIGRHRFKYNAKLLKDHLQNVMSYWHGLRQPSGVGVEDTRRCGWCEFEDGCEWRVQKAEEAMAKMKLKRTH